LTATVQKLSGLQALEPQLKTEEQTAEGEFQDRDRESRSESEKLSGLRMKLHELLGDQSIEQFRLAIEEQQESARKKLDNAERVRNAADNALTADSTRDESLQQQLSDARKAESAAQERLHAWLAEFSPQLSPDDAYVQLQQIFGHDSNWIEGERKALQELADAVKTAAGEVRACEQRLEEHQRQRTDERDEAAVQAALATQLETERAAQARLQEVQRVLKNDDDTRSGNAKLDAAILDLEVQARPWLDLDQLIGSADGKKFTLMAQRFTLDLLLQHANVQLRELAGRYRLERLGESLNLGVIDQDLGSELRSVHSLSGGETFLVSLALALGLASLTSSRLRIESLFIDEGFGSLDEDTLEVAMNALNHLQSQGRKVGVITHVERMQDAISTQIHVRRGPGGASRIVLPRSDMQAD
jgi:exonuclease SbcC